MEDFMPSVAPTLINQLAEDPNIKDDTKLEIVLSAGHIYKLISSDNLEKDALLNKLCDLADVVSKYTNKDNKSLNDIQKLKLTYVFQDLMDDVKIRIASEKEEPKQQGWFSSWTKQVDTGDEESITKHEMLTFADRLGNLADVESLLHNVMQSSSWPQMPGENFQSKVSVNEVHSTVAEVRKFKQAHVERLMDVPQIQPPPGKLRSMWASIQKTTEVTANLAIDAAKATGNVAADTAIATGNLAVNAAKATGRAAINAVQLVPKAVNATTNSVSQTAQAISGEIQGQINALYERKEQMISGLLSAYTPGAIFGDRSFQSIIAEAIERGVQEVRWLPNEKTVIPKIVSKLRSNLSSNVNLINEPRNMCRLGIKMNEQLETAIRAISQMSEDDAPEILLLELASVPISVNTFKREVHARLAENLSSLLSNRASIKDKPSNSVTRITRGVKSAFNNIGDRVTANVVEHILLKVAPSATEFLGDLPEIQSNIAVNFLGLNRQAAIFNQHSELIGLYLLDSLIHEMTQIASESRASIKHGNSGHASDFETEDQATNAMRESIQGVGAALAELKPEGFAGAFLSTLSRPAAAFLKSQGTEDSLFDITTPAYTKIINPWMNWLAS